MKPLKINADDKILIVAPHPDDECIGCGGILLSFPQQCTVWVLTDGRFGGINIDPHKTIVKRKQEFIHEMSRLHIRSYRLFDEVDSRLQTDFRIGELEALEQFTKIFVPNRLDNHPDHVASFQIMKREIEENNLSCQLYQYEISTPLTITSDYLDITELIEKKMELIQYHQSQLLEYDYCRMAKSLNAFRATLKKREGYVEAYCRMD